MLTMLRFGFPSAMSPSALGAQRLLWLSCSVFCKVAAGMVKQQHGMHPEQHLQSPVLQVLKYAISTAANC